jgi:hypothetical protein
MEIFTVAYFEISKPYRYIYIYIYIYIKFITASVFIPGGSGTTMTHNTQ